ncbi:MAG TPA: hypothetical protein VMX38_01475 [Verrucomicrobiae bacterium]|jgi:hypothetical protein|nr:hypothetical protein [Verrucomicrobiae bacterium]
MSGVIAWMAAEADESWLAGVNGSTTEDTEEDRGQIRCDAKENPHLWQKQPEVGHPEIVGEGLVAHSFPADGVGETLYCVADEGDLSTTTEERPPEFPPELEPEEVREQERQRRIYRGRTISMLRRYLRYSIETGRLPSLLGREFFRSKVTSYSVATFEDRVIFVHDMESCLDRLDEFSRQLIARHILQEHDQEATARLLQCTGRTVRTYMPIVLDTLSEILLELGLMERTFPNREKSCQGGLEGENFVSDSCERKNNF